MCAAQGVSRTACRALPGAKGELDPAAAAAAAHSKCRTTASRRSRCSGHCLLSRRALSLSCKSRLHEFGPESFPQTYALIFKYMFCSKQPIRMKSNAPQQDVHRRQTGRGRFPCSGLCFDVSDLAKNSWARLQTKPQLS